MPGAPTNLVAVGSAANVTLVWTAPAGEGVTGYQILRRTDAEQELSILVDDTASTSTVYSDDAVETETTYVYQVKARNAQGTGPGSNEATATTQPLVTMPAMHHRVNVSDTTLIVEEGGSNSYDVTLASAPTADVTVTVNVPMDSNLTVDNDELTFSTTTWSVAQTVTVTSAVDSNTVTDMVTITHTATSTDTDFNDTPIQSVEVTIYDSSYRIQVDSGDEELSITEGNSTATTLCFSLSDAPTEDVTVTLAPDAGPTCSSIPRSSPSPTRRTTAQTSRPGPTRTRTTTR